ncbi:MAG: putative membrane protein [Verrucomicrobiales bacterium]|jgi:uncharacterized membrane protein
MEIFEHVETVADVIDAAVVILLVLGTTFAFLRAAFTVFTRGSDVIRHLRIDLGQSLLLSLEVLIISDILHSIVKRSIEDLTILGVIVVIRVTLAFFLDREITHLRHEIAKSEKEKSSES